MITDDSHQPYLKSDSRRYQRQIMLTVDIQRQRESHSDANKARICRIDCHRMTAAVKGMIPRGKIRGRTLNALKGATEQHRLDRMTQLGIIKLNETKIE